MATLLNVRPPEDDLDQASLDPVITAVHLHVIDGPQDGLIVIDSGPSAPQETGDALTQVVGPLAKAPPTCAMCC